MFLWLSQKVPSIESWYCTQSCLMLLLFPHPPIYTHYVIIHLEFYVDNTSETFWKKSGDKSQERDGGSCWNMREEWVNTFQGFIDCMVRPEAGRRK